MVLGLTAKKTNWGILNTDDKSEQLKSTTKFYELHRVRHIYFCNCREINLVRDEGGKLGLKKEN